MINCKSCNQLADSYHLDALDDKSNTEIKQHLINCKLCKLKSTQAEKLKKLIIMMRETEIQAMQEFMGTNIYVKVKPESKSKNKLMWTVLTIALFSVSLLFFTLYSKTNNQLNLNTGELINTSLKRAAIEPANIGLKYNNIYEVTSTNAQIVTENGNTFLFDRGTAFCFNNINSLNFLRGKANFHFAAKNYPLSIDTEKGKITCLEAFISISYVTTDDDRGLTIEVISGKANFLNNAKKEEIHTGEVCYLDSKINAKLTKQQLNNLNAATIELNTENSKAKIEIEDLKNKLSEVSTNDLNITGVDYKKAVKAYIKEKTEYITLTNREKIELIKILAKHQAYLNQSVLISEFKFMSNLYNFSKEFLNESGLPVSNSSNSQIIEVIAGTKMFYNAKQKSHCALEKHINHIRAHRAYFDNIRILLSAEQVKKLSENKLFSGPEILMSKIEFIDLKYYFGSYSSAFLQKPDKQEDHFPFKDTASENEASSIFLQYQNVCENFYKDRIGNTNQYLKFIEEANKGRDAPKSEILDLQTELLNNQLKLFEHVFPYLNKESQEYLKSRGNFSLYYFIR